MAGPREPAPGVRWVTSPRPVLLVVEDEARNAALVQAVLGSAGYELVVVGSLAGARAWLAGHRPDLVLLDIGLPDGSGLDLARELRATPATSAVPILVASARVLPEDRLAAQEAGCDAFLGKPIGPRELLEAVATHLVDAGRPSGGRRP
ncbi:MAG TPA: response regulator [Candidatus Limnocylindrales bacterium]|nr:response regulator [Candidatus Limnocylindrales bacterium]